MPSSSLSKVEQTIQVIIAQIWPTMAPATAPVAEASFQALLRDITKDHGEHPNFGLVKVVCDKSPNEGVEWVHPDCVEAFRAKGLSLLRPKK